MILDKLKSIKSPLKDKDTFMKMMMIIFLILPVLYVIYLEFTSKISKIEVKEMLLKDTNASLNLISNFACVYGAYAIYHIRQDLNCRENMIGFYLLLMSQILAMTPITIMMMLVYIFHFIGFTKINYSFNKTIWKKSYKALLSSIVVLIISIIVFIIRMKLFA